ncbi:MAG: hypothetical protein EOP85_14165 [Verrucomicrobiaceae bacterium]|nr:MAG: hypothetical protein EOP85_14165 [Verrucomicrobiaceae bacterium]
MISTAAAAEASAKPVDEWIRDLADPKFRTREEASRNLWSIGESALAPLNQAAAGEDPEQAFRARELIRKIQLFITPDTDAEVIGIVEKYEKALENEKLDLIHQLQQKRAWRQILKLYASETSARARSQIQGQGLIDRIPVTAAREALKKGDIAGAREFLEMAPATPSGLLSLAEFHRTQGSLEKELQRAKTLEGKQGAAWRLALYRASGNLEAAKVAADEAGEPAISAAMSVLLGDPLPWIRRDPQENSLRQGPRVTYADLAAKRWQGSTLRPSDLEPLLKATNSRNRSERTGAVTALLLLGDPVPAEKAITRYVPLEAFSYFETLERVPESLATFGLDPAKPDYEGWVRERMDKLTASLGADEEDRMEEYDQELDSCMGE